MSNRGPNNELLTYPGFYYCPSDDSGLVRLSDYERWIFMVKNSGGMLTMAVMPSQEMNPGEYTDMLCALDNRNIPTHYLPGAKFPSDLPFANLSKDVTSRELTALNAAMSEYMACRHK